MKKASRGILVTAALFAFAGIVSAHTLTVSPAGPVAPGTMLTFTAVIDAVDAATLAAPCQQNPQNMNVAYFVREPVSAWMTETYATKLAGPGFPKTVTFTSKFTVPANVSSVTFKLIGQSTVCFIHPSDWREFASVTVAVKKIEFRPPLVRIPILDCFPEPGCPTCLQINLDKLNDLILPEVKEQTEARLMYQGRLVAVLGQFGAGVRLPASKGGIRLNEAEMALLKRGATEFTLVFAAGSRIVKESKVQLKLAR